MKNDGVLEFYVQKGETKQIMSDTTSILGVFD